MKRQFLMMGLACMALALPAVAEEKHSHSSTNPGFEKMKTLVGTWVVADEAGQPTDQVASVIRLTAAGSVLEETLFPGSDHEMISMYTADGPSVMLTHYCMLGNQPQMKADSKIVNNTLNFEFAGGGNLDPQKDKHMHGAVLTFVDADHIQVEGVAWDEGKPAKEMCGRMNLVRKK